MGRNRRARAPSTRAPLVEPGHQPAARLDALPEAGGTVLAVAAVPAHRSRGRRFGSAACAWPPRAGTGRVLPLAHGHVLRQVNLRFERALWPSAHAHAQEPHDTPLQGFTSASDAAAPALARCRRRLPEKTHLARVLAMMRQVIEEGPAGAAGLRS